MIKNQHVTGISGVSFFSELEQISLSQMSESCGVPVKQLLAAANSLPNPAPVPLLLPGPVAVHVDGVQCFTPTVLGERIGLSAQKFNRMLVEHGLQQKHDGQWCPTEAGKAFSVLLQVHKKQQSGTDVLQLKWKETVMAVLSNSV